MNTEDYNSFSKRGRRQIPPFIASELLYDYVTFQLDADRKEAVDAILKESKELQADLTRVSLGVSYASQLQNVTITDELLAKVQTPSSYFDVLVKKIKFEEWPTGLRLGLESLLVITGIVSVSLMVPWHKVTQLKFEGSQHMVLTEVSNTYKQEEPLVVVSGRNEPDTFPDEVTEDATPTQAQPSPQPVTPAPKPAVPAVAAPTPTSPPAPAPAPVAATPTPEKPVEVAAAAPAETTAKATMVEDPSAEGKRQGFLYRGSMTVTNVDAVSPKITEKVLELGGRKAGSVNLGWRKGTGSYYHFTMPEKQYEGLLAFLKDYGVLKIQREKHDRVMPDGIIRVIIQVDEKKNDQ